MAGNWSGTTPSLWKFSDVSFAAVAETMGAKGIRVEKPGEIAGALEQAFAAQGPCVVDVLSDIDAIAPWGYVGACRERDHDPTN